MQIAEPKWQHRSFFDEIDMMVPAFEPSSHMTTNEGTGQGAVLYPTSEPSQRVSVATWYDNASGEPQRVEFAMPFQQYLRAMDAAGNIQPLTIKTCQIASEDTTGFDQSIIARKVQAGWIICERNQPNALGLVGEQYGEHIRKEWLRRRREHLKREQAQDRLFMSTAEKSAQEDRARADAALERQSDIQQRMVADMAGTITQAVVAGLAASEKRSSK